MNRAEIIHGLKTYIAQWILDGEDIGLDEATPLIEWGILNSMEIARIVGFVSDKFGVSVPSDKITLDNFETIGAIGDLVWRAQDGGA
jgi:acyl carrier protein